MAKELPKKSIPAQPETPSGKFDTPIQVAITGTKPDNCYESLEKLVVNSMAQLIYGGDKASSTFTLGDVKSLTSKENPIALLNNINQSINVKINKLNENVKPIVNNVKTLTESMATSNDLVSGIFSLLSSASKAQPTSAQQKPTSVDTKSVGVLTDSIRQLLDSTDEFIDLNEVLTSFDENIENINKKLTELSKLNDDVERFANATTPFVVNVKALSEIKDLNMEGLDSLSSALTSLSLIDIDESKSQSISQSLSILGEGLSNPKLSEIDPIAFDPLFTVTDKLQSFSNLQNIDLTTIDNLINQIPRLNLFIEAVSKVDSLNDEQQEAFTKLSKFIGGINIEKTGSIDKEFVDHIRALNDIVLPRTIEIIPLLKELTNNVEFIDPVMLLGANDLFEALGLLDTSSIDKSKFSTKAAERLSVINQSLPVISDIVKELDNVDKLDLGNKPTAITNIGRILQGLSKFKFTESGVIDFKKLKDTLKLIPRVNSIITQIENTKLGSKDHKEQLKNIGQIVAICEQLEKLKFSGENDINEEELTNMNENVIPILSDITNKLSTSNVKLFKKSQSILESMVKILMLSDQLSYIGKNTINLDKLNDLNLSLPVMISVNDKLGKANIENNAQKIQNLAISLKSLSNIDTDEFEDKDYRTVAIAIDALANIGKIFADFDDDAIVKADKLKTFVENAIVLDTSAVKQFMNNANNINKETIERSNNTAKLVESLANAAKTVSALAVLGPLVQAGLGVLHTFATQIHTISEQLGDADTKKKVDAAMSTMKAVSLLIGVATLVMLVGGAFIVFFPKLVLGAIAFGLVLGLFIFTVLGAINLASRGLKTSFETMKAVSLLIVVSTLTMLIGAAFVVGFPQLVLGAIAFGLVLGLFIFTVLGAINLASRGLDLAFDIMQDVALLIAVCTVTMLIGATFVIYFPKLILGAMLFTVLLGGFIFATLKAINLGTKGMDSAIDNIKDFTKLIVVSTAVMILGGALVMFFPEIIGGAMLFTVMLGGFIFATLKAINLGTRGIDKNLKSINQFAIIIGVSATVLLAGGGLFVANPDLIWATPLFGAIFAGFTYIMGKALGSLSKQQGNLIKGAAAIAIISGAIAITSASMLMIANAMDHGILEVTAGALVMSATIGVVALMTVALGTASMNPFFWAGVGAMASISGIILAAAAAMLLIAQSMKIFKEVGKFDIKPTLEMIMGFTSIASALVPVGLLAPVVIAASLAVSSLSIAISMISAAVAEAASLKIPIYQGTKKIGYRQLKQTDFTDAGKNVTAIVTTLGKAMIDIYKKSPEMFADHLFGDNPFTCVVKSTSKLGQLISKISEAVKDYADLKIPIYNGTKITGYRHLGKKDFQDAGNNVKDIILTLSGALIKLYEEHPEMYQDKSIFSFMGSKPGNTPLSIVISVTKKLGSLISEIAEGVQDYANMKIPTKYNNDGKAIAFRQMKPEEVLIAGNNAKDIILTLSGALIKLYEEHPEMYQDKSIFSFMGSKPGNTPLSIVISVTKKLGSLISSIAEGVQDYANMKIPIEWNKDGKAIKFRSMSPDEVKGAGKNIKSVILTLSNSLIELYNENQKMFEDKSIFSFMGSKPGNTPLSIVISVTKKLGSLISEIAEGVQDFGNLKIPVEWNKDGKAIKFRSMSETEILKAGENVTTIVSVLGNSLMSSYDEHKEWYKAPESLFGSIFGNGGGAKKTPFYTVVATNLKLADLISKIGQAVGKMAKLTIPTKWSEDGKAIEFRTLAEQDFDMAGENIGKIITVLGNAIMQQYDDHNDWFCDKDGDLMKDGKNKFSIVMKTTVAMSEVIKNIATGVKDYANLLIPDEWDKEGKAIHFRELTPTDFEQAGTNIGKVIETVGLSIMKVHDANPDWFENKGGFFGIGGESDFSKVLTSCTAMGDMISNISSGVSALAQLMIPTKWSAEGKPIEFREMNYNDFVNAGANIKEIVSVVGQSLIDLYDSRPDLFETNEDNPDSPFTKVAQGCSYLGTMIKGIAEGVAEMATLEETLKKAGIKIGPDVYKEAADKISDVVCVIGDALLKTFNGHKEWFENPPIIEENSGFFGIGASRTVKPDNSDTPFQKVVKACALMGGMIISIAEGVAIFAQATQKGMTLDDGTVIQMDIPKATENIGMIITTVGGALMKVANSGSFYTIDKLEPIINAVRKSAGAVMSVADLLEKIGTGELPILDKEGNVIKTLHLDNTSISAAAETIGLVISGVSGGLESAKSLCDNIYPEFSFFGSRGMNTINSMLDNIEKAIRIVGNNAYTLAKLGIGELYYWNKDFTEIVHTIHFTKADLTNGADTIADVLTSIAKGVGKAYDEFERHFGWWLSDNESSIVNLMIESAGKAMSVVGSNAYTLAKLGTGQIDLFSYNRKNGEFKIVKTIKFTKQQIIQGAEIISTVLTTIARAVGQSAASISGFVGWGDQKWENTIAYMAIKAVEEAKNVVGKMALFLSHLGNGEYVYFDTRYKKERSVPVSVESMHNAALMVALVLRNIAWGIGEGANYISSINLRDITKMLESVEDAKQVVGGMALFLSHLGNGEYVYFDTRYKKERSVPVSVESMSNAANMISTILTQISSGISIGANSMKDINFIDVWTMMDGVKKSINLVGDVAYFMGNLGNGEYVYRDIFDGLKEKKVECLTVDSMTNAATIVKTIITTIADAIAAATDKLNSDGFTLFGKSDDDKISLTFKALNKATSMLGRIAKVVSYYGNGEIASVTIGTDGSQSIERAGAPDVNSAKNNINTIVSGLADIIKETSDKINSIENIEDTIIKLQSSMKVIDASIYAVNRITEVKDKIVELSGFSFGSMLTPVLDDIDMIFDRINNIGSAGTKQLTTGLFGLGKKEDLSPFRKFIFDTNLMVMEAANIAAVPMEQSFNTLHHAITTTMDTMSKVQMPDNFAKQVEDLSKFVKTVNTIKIEGVDSLTELLKELNKLGINMGNLDKLTDALANKLTIVLKDTKKVMEDLNKTMIEDGKRKKKHEQQVKKSVEDIRKVMASTMNVIVKMDDSNNPGGGSANPSLDNNENNNKKPQGGGEDTKQQAKKHPA